MRYWTIVEPVFGGDQFRASYVTLSEDEILNQYWDYWSKKMKQSGYLELISKEKCIEDWCNLYWAWETDSTGESLEPNIVRGYN